MMRLRWLMLGVILVAHSVAADCCGDCDGSGAVRVNELVTSVNNALQGCGATMAKPLKPRFVQIDGNFSNCSGPGCTLANHEGAGVLMWVAVSVTGTSSDTLLVALDDDDPQVVRIERNELRKLPNESTLGARTIEIPFGGLRFAERLHVSIPEGTSRPTLTLYYLVE